MQFLKFFLLSFGENRKNKFLFYFHLVFSKKAIKKKYSARGHFIHFLSTLQAFLFILH